MKKTILCILLVLLLVTGCKKEEEKKEIITCTFNYSSNGDKHDSTVTAEVKDGIIVNATNKMHYEKEESAKTFCEITKKMAQDAEGNLECNGNDITMKNYHKSIKNNGDISKEDFLRYMSQERYNCTES